MSQTGFIKLRAAAVLVAVLALAGCSEGAFVQTVSASNTVFDIAEVVRLTPETARLANASPYVPQSLPAAFSPSGVSVNDAVSRVSNPWPTDLAQPEYRIGVGDVLSIRTSSHFLSPSLSTEAAGNGVETLVQVEEQGTISLTDLGDIPVRDLTLAEARDRLEVRFREGQIDPRFQLSVAEFKARSATVTGAVTRPGVIPIELAALSVDEALALAGGVNVSTPQGVRLRLLRGAITYEVGLETYNARADLRRAPLRDGDQLVVLADEGGDARRAEAELLRVSDADRRDRFAQSEARGAIARDFVYVAGEVERQRRFTLPFQTRATLADALFDEQNGVARATGDPSEIYIIRLRQESSLVIYHLSAANAANLALATLVELRPNDILFVSERPISAWNRIIQSLLPVQLLQGTILLQRWQQQ